MNKVVSNLEDIELVGILGELLDDSDPDVDMTEKVRKGIYTVYSTLCERCN
jgi:hypothetical protein